MGEDLLYCTIGMIEFLILRYQNHTLSYDDFKNCTKIKIEFLREYMNALQPLKARQHAEALVSMYDRIITESAHSDGKSVPSK